MSPTASDSPRLAGLSLIDVVAGLGSTAPAPGAGAAGAIALALGAACAAKAFAISARHAPDRALDEAAERAQRIASIALQGAQRDAVDFRAWLRTHDRETEAALKADADILVGLAGELDRLVADMRPKTVSSLVADLDAALALLRACRAIERRNLADL